MIQCSNCGAQNQDDSLFCTECGKLIKQDNICPKCGASINDGDAFCTNCGNRLLSEMESSESVDTECQPERLQNKKSLSAYSVATVILGLLVLGIIGGGWYYMKTTQDDSQPTAVVTDSTGIEDRNLESQIREQLQTICDYAIRTPEEEVIEKYFSSEFKQLYKKVIDYDKKIWDEEESLGYFDFMFWTGGQDGDLTKMEVKQIEIQNEKEAIADVLYTISFEGIDGEITDESKSINSFNLLLENGKWVIDDLRNYKNDFKEYIEASKEESKKKEEEIEEELKSQEELARTNTAIGAFQVEGNDELDEKEIDLSNGDR